MTYDLKRKIFNTIGTSTTSKYHKFYIHSPIKREKSFPYSRQIETCMY